MQAIPPSQPPAVRLEDQRAATEAVRERMALRAELLDLEALIADADDLEETWRARRLRQRQRAIRKQLLSLPERCARAGRALMARERQP